MGKISRKRSTKGGRKIRKSRRKTRRHRRRKGGAWDLASLLEAYDDELKAARSELDGVRAELDTVRHRLGKELDWRAEHSDDLERCLDKLARYET